MFKFSSVGEKWRPLPSRCSSSLLLGKNGGRYQVDVLPFLLDHQITMDNETDTSTAGVNGTISISNLICVSTSSLEFKVDSVGFFAGESPFLFPFPILLFQILICLAVPRVFYYLLRPLKQPRIVAVLLFCMLINPTAMGSIKVKTGNNSVRSLWSVIFPREFEAVTRTIADTGITLYLFIIGVKMEPSIVMRSGKKTWIIALVSFLFPFVVVGVVFCFLQGKLAAGLVGGPFLFSLDCMMSITSFAVLSDVFSELNLLNSELGRLAMACSMVHGIFALVLVSFNIVLGHILKGPLQAAEAILSLWSLIFVIVFGFRPWMQSLVKKTPQGGRIDDVYIFVIFALVVALGVASDAIGAMFTILPLMFGLAVPQGPPLGSALAERGQLLANEVLMPLLFLLVAAELDFTSFRSESGWLLLVLCMESTAKLVGTMASAIYCQFSLQNSLLLGLIMTFRGMVEILHFLSFRNADLLSRGSFTVMIIMIAAVTSITAPLVTTLHRAATGNCSRANRRSIQHLKPKTEFRLLACVHNEIPIPSIMKLIEASCPTEDMPICIYVLHLVELGGRSASSLVAHKNKKGFVNPSRMDRLHNVFLHYEQDKGGYVAVQPFTSISPLRTMHQDVCSLAAEKNVALILVPFRRMTSAVATEDVAIRTNMLRILTQAPCSVGILVYPDEMAVVNPLPDSLQHQICILFWGGPDDREALSYASSRMIHRNGVSLTIVHFILPVDQRDGRQRQLDDDLLLRVQFENMNSEHVSVHQVMVRDVGQTIAAIRSLGNRYGLMMVGRRQGPNSLLDLGLSDWSECPELGVVGDMLASKDFDSASTILVVQQQN